MTEVKNLVKRFGNNTVYDGFSYLFPGERVTAVLGESGSGKTTLLNILAGTLAPDGGEVSADKPVSFVFQEDRLLPNLTVSQNLELICGKRDYSEDLAAVGLKGCEHAYIRELSGGMARRLSFLRAFLFHSKLILLDEPFRNLDLKLKYSLMDMFLSLQEKSPRTAVFVTHDPEEASYLSSAVVVLSKGGKILFSADREKGQPFDADILKRVLIGKENL